MKKNSMTRDAMLFLPAKIVEGLLIIFCNSLYTHIFTKEAAGAFGIINTNVNFAYLILCGWMANAATRYVGEEYQRDRGQKLFTTISTVYLLIGGAAAAFLTALAFITKDAACFAGALMFCTYTLFQILNSALIQLGRMKASIFLSLTSAVLKLAVAYLLVGGVSDFPTPYPALFANTLADGIAGVCAVFVLSIPTLYRLRYFDKTLLRTLLRYGVPLMGVSISVGLLNTIDKYLVVGFFGEATFAVYNNNNSIASGIFTMLSVGIMRGVYPAVLRGWREGGAEEAKPLLNTGVRLYLLIAMPAVAGLSAIALPLSRFLYAPGYEAGAPVIGLTALAMFFMGLTEYANKAYELEASTVSVLQNSAVSAIVKILASIVFLQLFGFIGGAAGSVFAFCTYFVITAVRVRKRFLFYVPPRRVFNILFSSLLCFLAAFAVTMLPLPNALLLACAIPAGGIVYAVSIVLSGEARDEVKLLLQKCRRS